MSRLNTIAKRPLTSLNACIELLLLGRSIDSGADHSSPLIEPIDR